MQFAAGLQPYELFSSLALLKRRGIGESNRRTAKIVVDVKAGAGGVGDISQPIVNLGEERREGILLYGCAELRISVGIDGSEVLLIEPVVELLACRGCRADVGGGAAGGGGDGCATSYVFSVPHCQRR